MQNTTQVNGGRPLWETTKYQNLVRYTPSGTLYARFNVKGKPIRKSLKTAERAMAPIPREMVGISEI